STCCPLGVHLFEKRERERERERVEAIAWMAEGGDDPQQMKKGSQSASGRGYFSRPFLPRLVIFWPPTSRDVSPPPLRDCLRQLRR
ncbi:unnamed protein product, partial [Brassica oleracea]